MATAPRRVLLFTFAGGQTLDVVGPAEVFAGANAWAAARDPGPPAYRVEIVARRAGPVAMGSGVVLMAERDTRSVRGAVDTLLVAGGSHGLPAARADADLPDWLRRQAARARRVGSVCTGAFLLAGAGLLDGRRVTTHWAAAERLAREHPRLRVEPDAIWVRDGRFYSSAGVSAGMDLALALVEEDLGREAALAVARHLVLFLQRPGGQSQFSAHLEAQTRARGPLAELPDWIERHLDGDLSVPALAERVGMSPRNFARVFARCFGATPAKYVERARLERARACLDEGRRGLEEVADLCGFGSAERMRKTFLRHLRVSPQDYRGRFGRALRRSA